MPTNQEVMDKLEKIDHKLNNGGVRMKPTKPIWFTLFLVLLTAGLGSIVVIAQAVNKPTFVEVEQEIRKHETWPKDKQSIVSTIGEIKTKVEKITDNQVDIKTQVATVETKIDILLGEESQD